MTGLMSKRQWAKVLLVNRLNRACLERGFCRRSGKREWRSLARQQVFMERCLDCTVLAPVDGKRWAA